MGAWGVQPFENDKADDWISFLTGEPDLGECRSALREFERSEWECGVAAADVVAAAAGYPGPGLPSEIAAWLGTVDDRTDADDVIQAFRMTDEVLLSDVRGLFDDAAVWLAAITDLRVRLRSAADVFGVEVE